MLARLIRDIKGATAIEFAFIAPIFLIMVFAGFEVGRYVMIMNKLQATGFALANIVAQTEPANRLNKCLSSRLTQSGLSNILTGSIEMMRPFSIEDARYNVIVTAMEKTNNGLGIRWQHQQGSLGGSSEISGSVPAPCSARPCPTGSKVTFADGSMDARFAPLQTGESIIALEVFYRYEPVFPKIFGMVTDTFRPKTLSERVYFYNRLGKLEFLPPVYPVVDELPCTNPSGAPSV